METMEMFKEYLDHIVANAFVKGATWEINKDIPMEEAIKKAQDEILELKLE